MCSQVESFLERIARMKRTHLVHRFIRADIYVRQLKPLLKEEKRLLGSMARPYPYGSLTLMRWTGDRIRHVEALQRKWTKIRSETLSRLGFKSLDDARWHLIQEPRITHWPPRA